MQFKFTFLTISWIITSRALRNFNANFASILQVHLEKHLDQHCALLNSPKDAINNHSNGVFQRRSHSEIQTRQFARCSRHKTYMAGQPPIIKNQNKSTIAKKTIIPHRRRTKAKKTKKQNKNTRRPDKHITSHARGRHRRNIYTNTLLLRLLFFKRPSILAPDARLQANPRRPRRNYRPPTRNPAASTSDSSKKTRRRSEAARVGFLKF